MANKNFDVAALGDPAMSKEEAVAMWDRLRERFWPPYRLDSWGLAKVKNAQVINFPNNIRMRPHQSLISALIMGRQHAVGYKIEHFPIVGKNDAGDDLYGRQEKLVIDAATRLYIVLTSPGELRPGDRRIGMGRSVRPHLFMIDTLLYEKATAEV